VTTTILGVRHHGPGSARAVRSALAVLEPDVVLIEGPPEADALVRHVTSLTPPVAVLAHAVDQPGRAAFWPYADFSPEWQALVHAAAAGRPARFMDLPAAVMLAADEESAGRDDGALAIAADPLGWLSLAAGHDDPERWWEDVVEHRLGGDPLELFAAIAEAMTELRAAASADGWQLSERDAQREAAMRAGLRAAAKAGHEAIAVVCGAWHVPALMQLPPARADAEVLRRLPTTKVRATWVPWTSHRLTLAGGYGAGVASPGWYAHLWRAPDRIVERWVVRAAGLLRAADLPASTAAALETVRLAEATAALRGRSLPGLSELTDAIQAVLCHGDATPLQLVTNKLTVGEELGEVPPEVPVVPLQADFEALCRRLRFRPQPADKDIELDLRGDTDRARSALLHRLRLLGVPWGTVISARGEGTFREGWRLRWRPEYIVSLIEQARFGTTVQAAAGAVVTERAARAGELPAITALVEAVVLADLPAALPGVTAALEQRSATTGDVQQLMLALAPLARVLRYGDVRQTSGGMVRGVVDSLLIRICAGLPAASAALDDAAAASLLAAIEAAQDAVAIVGTPDQVSAWRTAQRSVCDLPAAPGLVAGRCVRLLLDTAELQPGEAQQRLARALSARDETAHAVRWLDGFLRGSGLLLLRDEVLWVLLDEWLSGLTAEAFDEVLPLLRRSFAQFPAPERRQMGELARSGRRGPPAPGAGEARDWDAERVRQILPVLAAALGVPAPGPEGRDD
jgi:hypothetical protein